MTDDRPRDAHRVPGYRLLEVVDRRPELGTSYRAQDLRRNAPVEVTVIAAVLSRNAGYRERFDRRRRVLSTLRHPALVRELDAGECADGLFVVAEPAVGVPLRTVLERGPLAPDRALAILAPVAGLLDRLRADRLWAGDLSPRRILVRDGDRASLIAPGLAAVSLLASARLEVSADALEYSSPEQLRGLAADARSDVYALAAILFESITGRSLFAGAAPETETGLPIRAVLARRALPAPAVSARHRRLGPQFDAVLKAALSEPPAMRPATAGQLVERLAWALEQEGAPSLAASVSRPRGQAPERPAGSAGRVVALPARRGGPAPARESAPGEPDAVTASAGPATDQGPDRAVERTLRSRAAKDDGSRPTLHGMRALAPATAAAMLAGLILALSSDEPARPAAQTTLSSHQLGAGHLRISYPSTWQPERRARGAARLSLTAPAALVPRPGVEAQPDSRLVAGMATDTGPSLLSPELERRLDGAKREAVRLGEHEAFRYRDVPLGGQNVDATLYAVPTSAGVATIACFSPRFIDTLAGQCEAMATTLTLSRADSLPLGPNVAYGRRVDRIVAQADAARRQGRARLRFAKRAPGQGRRAADLAMTFRRSAARLAASGPEAGTALIHRDLVGALRGVRNGYEALSTAAARRDRRGYDAARRLVAQREAALSQALKRMAKLGYRLRRS